jgi:hypothetical protein
MMKIVDTVTNVLAHVIELVPKAISILQAVGDMAQKLADTLKSFGSTPPSA